MDFRTRLLATLRAIQPVFEEAGVLVHLRHAVRSNLTILSLMSARHGMPDPTPRRELVAGLLRRFARSEGER